MPYVIFFAVLTVVFPSCFVLTQKQLGRARSLVPAVASSVRAPEPLLVLRRAVFFVCSLIAVGGLIAMINAHDADTWSDGEVLGIARDAADSLSDADSVSSPESAVNAAVEDAMRDGDGPGLLTTETSPTVPDDADDGADSTRYVISDHGRHAACLTVTSTEGAPILVPVPGGADPDDAGASRIDTYDLSATAARGAC
ncbi:hypothetical protein [Streptomyces sp. NBC_01497]|uniref:hypothetical protein n=1 Tax=Streptomyces sp. NBC_01497 TaxID=2903885 RepID=UPI002E314877|nr:hypothetical protein [Streptomyces sp. NBC_01497]